MKWPPLLDKETMAKSAISISGGGSRFFRLASGRDFMEVKDYAHGEVRLIYSLG